MPLDLGSSFEVADLALCTGAVDFRDGGDEGADSKATGELRGERFIVIKDELAGGESCRSLGGLEG
jgi:hypothetical protein